MEVMYQVKINKYRGMDNKFPFRFSRPEQKSNSCDVFPPDCIKHDATKPLLDM